MASNSGNVSIGEASASGKVDGTASNEPVKPDPTSKTLGEGQRDNGQPGPDASRYGEEGTNKTMPKPKPDNAPSEKLGGDQPHIPKSPYTRG
jgi:hypothetical protein